MLEGILNEGPLIAAGLLAAILLLAVVLSLQEDDDVWH